MTSAPQADLLFDNGPVFTADGLAAPADLAVAVAQDRIIAVGPEARDLAGPRTERVDLAGRLLVPGFQDSHIHAVFGGLELGRCDLSAHKSAADYLTAVREYARSRPQRSWITGGGWSLESFPGGLPTAAALDSVVPDRPVFLPNRDHHGAWVNSRALELAGITRDTPDPADGRIERDSRRHADRNAAGRRDQPRRVAAAGSLSCRIRRRVRPGPSTAAHARHHRLAGRAGRRRAGYSRQLRCLPARRRVRTAHRTGTRRLVVGARARHRPDRAAGRA